MFGFAIGIAVLVCILCLGLLFEDGLWGNIMTFIGVVLSALAAVALYEPLAKMLRSASPDMKYYWDFICLWVIFDIGLVIFRIQSKMLSPVMLKFPNGVNLGGGLFVALCTSLVLNGFIFFSFHVAPLMVNVPKVNSDQAAQTGIFDGSFITFVGYESRGGFAPLMSSDGFNNDEFHGRFRARREKFGKSSTFLGN